MISRKEKGKIMDLKQSFMYLILFFLLAGFASSSTTYISYEALQSHESVGRNLLQALKKCDVDFEHMNYTILTSRCKGPQYPTKPCCEALKVFTCPVVDQVSDLKTDCASTMFSYINLYGKYPPGLFSNSCREGKEGLQCTEEEKPKNQVGRTALPVTKTTILLVILTSGLLMLLF